MAMDLADSWGRKVYSWDGGSLRLDCWMETALGLRVCLEGTGEASSLELEGRTLEPLRTMISFELKSVGSLLSSGSGWQASSFSARDQRRFEVERLRCLLGVLGFFRSSKPSLCAGGLGFFVACCTLHASFDR